MARRSSTRTRKLIRKRSESPVDDVSGSEDYEDAFESDSDDAASIHSDTLDEEETKPQKKRRRVASSSKRVHNAKTAPSAAPKSKRGTSEKGTPAKKKRKVVEEDAEDEDEGEVALKDGQEVVGKVVEAPKTGWAPEGQISQHMLDFLMHMQDPACNDRVWFKLHEPVYRRCEKEFLNFVEAFTTMLTEVDPHIPQLPPKDYVHRIYRDVRFSNDKTPYKTEFSAGFSRSGRKGIFAFFKPGDESMLAAGAWCPGKNELNMIRNHIKRSSDRFRQVISEPEFVARYGAPHPHPKGERQNIFGRDDELKTAPKGVDKSHKDIDLLKCRSFAVSEGFSDKQVLSATFIQEVAKVVRILRPFIHCLNDMITVPIESDSDDEDVPE